MCTRIWLLSSSEIETYKERNKEEYYKVHFVLKIHTGLIHSICFEKKVNHIQINLTQVQRCLGIHILLKASGKNAGQELQILQTTVELQTTA